VKEIADTPQSEAGDQEHEQDLDDEGSRLGADELQHGVPCRYGAAVLVSAASTLK
jgi:hypothetical protein